MNLYGKMLLRYEVYQSQDQNQNFTIHLILTEKTSKRSKNSQNDAKKMALDPNITYTIIGFTTSKW